MHVGVVCTPAVYSSWVRPYLLWETSIIFRHKNFTSNTLAGWLAWLDLVWLELTRLELWVEMCLHASTCLLMVGIKSMTLLKLKILQDAPPGSVLVLFDDDDDGLMKPYSRSEWARAGCLPETVVVVVVVSKSGERPFGLEDDERDEGCVFVIFGKQQPVELGTCYTRRRSVGLVVFPRSQSRQVQTFNHDKLPVLLRLNFACVIWMGAIAGSVVLFQKNGFMSNN